MRWEELLEALDGLMGQQVVASTEPTTGTPGVPRLAVLSVRGELQGGPVDPIDGADAVALKIVSAGASQDGSAVLLKPLFKSASQHPSGTLAIELGSITLELTPAAGLAGAEATVLLTDTFAEQTDVPDAHDGEADDEPTPIA